MKRQAGAIRSALLSLVLATFGAPRISTAQYTSENRDVLSPNTGAWPQDGVTLGGTTFINLGLPGVGRIPSTSIDPATGESLGSISDMQITGWTSNGNGEYSGTFNFLPDRGYNSGTTFSNYAARINQFSFTHSDLTRRRLQPPSRIRSVSLTFPRLASPTITTTTPRPRRYLRQGCSPLPPFRCLAPRLPQAE